MTTKELIQQYVTAHADNRWMDASELEALLTEFAEKLKESASEDSQKSEMFGWKEKGIALFTQIRVIPTILSTIQGHSQYVIQADANDEEVLLACPNFPCSIISKVKIVPCE